MPKAGSNYTSLTVILIDFVLKKDQNYYTQAFSRICKYVKKEKVIRHITDDLEVSFDNSDEESFNR